MRDPRTEREGGIAIVVALSLTTMLGFAALAIDATNARMHQAQVQNAVDAAARAATQLLDGTADGVLDAESVAITVAAQNPAGLHPVALAANPTNDLDGEIIFGSWTEQDDGTFAFVAAADRTADAGDIDAVRIRATTAVNPLLFTLAAFAVGDINASAFSTAVAQRVTEGAGEVDCWLPFAIPDCLIDQYGWDGIGEHTLYLNPAGIDNAGWVDEGTHTPSASAMRGLIESYSDESCEGDDEILENGDIVSLNNGVLSSALSSLNDEITASTEIWDETMWGPLPAQHTGSTIDSGDYGRVIAGPMVTFSDDSYCSSGGGSWNGQQEISGFVYGVIYDVRDTGPADQKNVWMVLDSTFEPGEGMASGGGGDDMGVTYVYSATVE